MTAFVVVYIVAGTLTLAACLWANRQEADDCGAPPLGVDDMIYSAVLWPLWLAVVLWRMSERGR